MNLDDAKRILRIYDVWVYLNLPGDCRKNPCHSPFYERTSKPSFSVFDDGRAFYDHRTGQKGSVIDFLMLATGLSLQEACRRIIEIAGGGKWDAPAPTRRPAPAPQERKKPELPPMDNGTESEMRQLAELRSLDFRAVLQARSLGLLQFANLRGHRAWIVTDGDGFNAQARRLDGKPWEHLDRAKPYTLPGCLAGFSLGAAQAENYPAVMLCEGGPDFLAAFHFILKADRVDVCPVAILGASHRIHEAALPMLAGKRVAIYPHVDENGAGQRAAERWRKQLHGTRATVWEFNFKGLRKADGSPVKDLNDCTQIHPDDAAELEDFLP